MLELIIYGLMGVAAVLVISFCLAFGDELSRVEGKSPVDPVHNAHLNDTRTGNSRVRGTVRTPQETTSTCLLQATSDTEADNGTVQGDGRRSLAGQIEGLHG
jgi:hypothetical protein